ncbi:MAG TPA: glycosyltransferase family 2 protein [Vicinamibacterales bacterium]|nr:glycosyltransferase family 2 protein [Vicinamibacterales bacterium]
MPTANVSVIVIGWNGGGLLRECLSSLRAQTYPCQTIVVDNGSTDGSQELVRREFPGVRLIENGRNLGFGEGNNIGMRAAMAGGAEYVALLNQDARAEPHWLEHLVRTAEADRTIGSVGSRMLLDSHPGLLNGTGVLVNLSGCAWDRGFARADGPAWREPVEIVAASGGAVLFRVEALTKIGLFDADYFAYFEDVDIGVRLWEAGYRVVYCPEAEVAHHFSSTLGDESPRKLLLVHGNRWRFLLKHFPATVLVRMRGVAAADRQFADRLRMGLPNVKLWIKVYLRALAAAPGALAYRLRHRVSPEQRERWWRLLVRQVGYPPIQVPAIDYDVTDSAADAWTDRVIMGVNDRVLGRGWYPLVRPIETTFDASEGPALREFGMSAACFLRVAAPGAYIIQLHVSQRPEAAEPREVSVTCNGRRAGGRIVAARGRWQTLQVPVTLDGDTAAVELRVDEPLRGESTGARLDCGLRVNEISVLPAGSPLLRTADAAAA